MTEICQKLIIPELDCDPSLLDSDPGLYASEFDQKGRPGSVGCLNWKDFPEKPEVSFRIGWCADYLLLKFYVKEREVLGRYTADGSNVYEDSCVELFLSPEGKDHYYNFEFNCIGCGLVQVGEARGNREVLPVETTSLIRRVSSLGEDPVHRYYEGLAADAEAWSLMLAIPSTVFVRDDIESFKGMKMRGNLYKCGDALHSPHYLSWNPIGTEQPDYHRPEYFGELWFS